MPGSKLFMFNIAAVAAAAPFLAKQQSEGGKVSITIATTNDVYSMYARPMSGNGYYFQGTPSEQFYSICEKDADTCYGTAGAMDMPEASVDKLYNIDLSATGGKVMTKEDSGCVDPSKFDDMVRDPASAWGNTAQMAGTYKYLGLTADTDEYISMLPGDFVAMSYLSSITYGQHMVDMMNAGEVDLVAFGDHEFQFKNKCPPADLADHPEYNDVCLSWNMATGNFLYLGSNVFEDAEKTRLYGSTLEVADEISFVNATVPKNKKVFDEETSYYAPSGNYWFKMVKDKKVCFTGTTEASADEPIIGSTNVWLSDEYEAGVNATREMNEDGCNLVIVLTHQREGYDVLFWRKAVVEEGIKIDAIIGGHDHFPAFLNLQHPTKPDIITPVWKMGMDGQMLGKFVFDFDEQHPDGKLRYAHAIPVFDEQCDQHFIGTDNEEWWNNNVMQTWTHWVQPIKPLQDTNMTNLLFAGFYDTADIRSAESRVGNMLADLFLRNLSAHFAALDGGNIRYGLSQNFTERIPLTELDLYEETPFLDGMVSYDMSLMEVFGYMIYSAPIAMGGPNAPRPVTSGFEIEMDPTTTEHGGVKFIRFTGTSHMAGIVNRTQTECGHPTLKCGEIIWNAEEGWKVDPFTMVIVTAPDYNARYSPDDSPTLRRSYYLTQMSDLCRRGAESYAIDLMESRHPSLALLVLTSSTPTSTTTTGSSRPHYTEDSIKAADEFCGSKAAGSYCMYWQTTAGQVCHGTEVSCSSLLVEGRRLAVADADSQTCWARLDSTIPERSVHVWTDEAVTPEGVKVIDTTTPMADGSAAAAMLLSGPWYVGGEHPEDLEAYGISDPDVESMEMANLPVRRWLESTPAASTDSFVLASFAGEAPKKTVGQFYGAKVNPRTILALHQ
ncbi:hypothetical protein Pmar_PMAR024504 [Perkinsus marinus ATCC 50983]|uniref:5'-Nucleotidase C-terminal domain-containing protein n=1 Tax=Perkinsus marinus (strain ATCC 50983 / TXsc) TaxID=423536 RepID=C5LT60_PERM5|nr:hypothetical protein Pmar_PMAR024504 [Perkinsus marinus ATCC 50983]EER00028.1 hypothetical protein Pmar_PMAR024504 [Perkinsus marinus ATCC 50983]|eukprot:XP_002767310.1 hypothetical protein Pmar_PMAR024504 [Perkinsus marinus ATCC 50983]